MKKLFGILFALFVLAGCGAASNDDALAAKYGLTASQYLEFKTAAEGMNMDVEAHLLEMGFKPKQ